MAKQDKISNFTISAVSNQSTTHHILEQPCCVWLALTMTEALNAKEVLYSQESLLRVRLTETVQLGAQGGHCTNKVTVVCRLLCFHIT